MAGIADRAEVIAETWSQATDSRYDKPSGDQVTEVAERSTCQASKRIASRRIQEKMTSGVAHVKIMILRLLKGFP